MFSMISINLLICHIFIILDNLLIFYILSNFSFSYVSYLISFKLTLLSQIRDSVVILSEQIHKKQKYTIGSKATMINLGK